MVGVYCKIELIDRVIFVSKNLTSDGKKENYEKKSVIQPCFKLVAWCGMQ